MTEKPARRLAGEKLETVKSWRRVLEKRGLEDALGAATCLSSSRPCVCTCVCLCLCLSCGLPLSLSTQRPHENQVETRFSRALGITGPTLVSQGTGLGGGRSSTGESIQREHGKKENHLLGSATPLQEPGTEKHMTHRHTRVATCIAESGPIA